MPLFHVCLCLCEIVHLSQRVSGTTMGLGVCGMSMCQNVWGFLSVWGKSVF